MARILILSTASDVLGETGKPTGVWYEELATPYYAFTDAGHEVKLATLGGQPVPIDPGSDATGEGRPFGVSKRVDELREHERGAVFNQPFYFSQGAISPSRQHLRRRIPQRCRPCDGCRKSGRAESQGLAHVRGIEAHRNRTRIVPMARVPADAD